MKKKNTEKDDYTKYMLSEYAKIEEKYEPKKTIYIEPAEYFPEEVRKEYGLGEYAEEKSSEESDK